MKMRGYSVLFVSVLCVFVLCGAAAVAAQAKTQERTQAEEVKAAEAATATVNVAKQKGTEALSAYNEFEGKVSDAQGDLEPAIAKIKEVITAVNEELTKKLDTENIKKEIGELDIAAAKAKATVEDLRKIITPVSKYEQAKAAVTSIIKDVDDNITMMVEKAAAVATGDVSAIDPAIERAGKLETAAKKARDLWIADLRTLTIELYNIRGAITDVNATQNKINDVVKTLESKLKTETKDARDGLSSVAKDGLESSLKKLILLQTLMVSATRSARVAAKQYDALAATARRLKKAAENRKQRGGKGVRGSDDVRQELPPQPLQSAQSESHTPPQPLQSAQSESHTPPQPLQSAQPESHTPPQPPQSPETQETMDYSLGPFCSLASPVFFLCWCVLFGM